MAVYFTAPTTTPRVSVRWKIRKKITVGAIPSSEAAASLLGIAPTIIFFLIFQRTLTRGVAVGSVK